jgi:Flp pilus assembly protein TadG
MRLRKSSRRLQSGQAIVLFSLMVSSVLIPVVGLAVDGGRGYLVKLKLSSAVDGGALAAARLLGSGSNSAQQLSMAKATAAQFVSANFPARFFGADLSGAATVCVDPGSDSSDPCGVGNGSGVSTYKVRTVVVSATAIMPTLFMRIIGMPTATVAGTGTASRRDVRVVLVMDRSSSMNTFFPDITDKARKFVSSFQGSGELGGRDEVGLVVFGGSGIVAYPARDISKDYTDYTKFMPPDNNFKVNAKGTIDTYLSEIASGSNTGTAEALYLAYMSLRADAPTNSDLATKLNVIVLFTDGLPNGITAFANDPKLSQYYMMKSSSGCTNLAAGKGVYSTPLVSKTNTNMIGWFSQQNGFAVDPGSKGAFGLYPPMMAYAYPGYTGKGDDIDAYMSGANQDNYPKNIRTTISPHMVNSAIDQMTGCAGGTVDTNGSTNGSPMNGTMAKFPDHDIYGNYTNLDSSVLPAVGGLRPPTGGTGKLYEQGDLWNNQCGKAAYSASATTTSCQIGLASWQATAHQAWKIWNQVLWDKTSQTNIADPATNQSQPVIFTIGFDHSASGGEAPDMTLLKMIANDASSTVKFSTRVSGKAYNAKDPGAVDAAFQQIRSEILRLAR